MIIVILILFLMFFLKYLIVDKVHINFKSFFRKGFPKNDDQYGVYCFCGKQGSGKTYSLVDSLEEKAHNKIVLCNIKSLCASHSNYIYANDFYDIMDIVLKDENPARYIIVYDEIFTLLEKGKLDKKCLSFLSQMRKRKIYLYTTAQEWLEINVTFRRYVRFQIECNMINVPILNFALTFNKVNDAYQMKWDSLQNEYVAPRIQTNIKKCSLKVANSYDTFETIEVADTNKKSYFNVC